MKSHFTVEQFFQPRLRTQLGVLLALLRVACAWAILQVCLHMHAAMPEVLVHLRVQTVPFLEAFATAWSFPFLVWVLVGAGCMFALGFFTRIATGILSLFLAGVFLIDRGLFFSSFGAWSAVGPLILGIALCSRWGLVFGIDEFIERLAFFRRKGGRRGMMR